MRRTSRLLIFALSLLPLGSFFDKPACGQARESRLRGSLADNSKLILPNSRIPQAETMQDLGAVSPDQVIAGITLVFNRSAEQEADLQKLLEQQQDAKSPLYHQWLTPSDFGARFGMPAADLEAAESWLAARGFGAISVSPGLDRITFTGTASEVGAAFGSELHRYKANGEEHFAPSSDLSLPAALQPVTAAVLHLSDFRPQPTAVLRAQPKPLYTTLATQAHFLTPYDLSAMYGVSPFLNNNMGGQGQSIAVVGQSYTDTSPTGPTGRMVGATLTDLSAVLVPGSGVEAVSPGDEAESDLDLEYALGAANKANVLLVFVGDQANYSVYDALTYAIQEKIAPVVSISYSSCETLLSASELNQANSLFAQAAAQGQTLIAASGDSGSTACAPVPTGSGLTTTQIQAPAVNFPADSPYVTAVGGTQMAPGTFTAGNTTYWASAVNVDEFTSLLSYVPEVAWNEGSPTAGILAGGGGTSSVYPRPSWQSGVTGIPAGPYRLLPDLALQSSTQSPGFLVCTDDPSVVSALGSEASCASGPVTSSATHFLAGGTSFAAPTFAGMVAILNQAENSLGQGNLNPTLYSLAGNPATYAAAFHDITSGNIACVTGATNCVPAGQAGYFAAAGYDEATGLGSVNLSALVKAWPATAASQQSPASAYLQLSLRSTTAGTPVLLTMNVYGVRQAQTGPLTAPTGTLSVLVDGAIVTTGIPLIYQGDPTSYTITATYTINAPATPGTHVISALYSGDPVYAPTVGTASLLVGDVLPSGAFALAAGNLTVANNSQGQTQVTLTPSSGYGGRVLWSLSATSATSGAPNLAACYLIAPLTANGVSTAKLVIGTGTVCNAPLTAQQRDAGRPLEQRAQTKPGSRKPLRPMALTLAGLLLCGIGRRKSVRRGLPALLSAALLMVVTMGVSGCGGGSPTTTNPVTPTPPVASAATYTLTLKGQDSVNTAIASSTTFTLTVQ